MSEVLLKFLNHSDVVEYASDIFIQVNNRPWVNINRQWQIHPHLAHEAPVTQEELNSFVAAAFEAGDPEESAEIRSADGSLQRTDFSFSIGFAAEHGADAREIQLRLRGHTSQDHKGQAVDIRVLSSKIHSMAELGFHEGLSRKLMQQRNGLILVGGKTGAGKSTTLAAIVRNFWETYPGTRIITLEDPVEHVYQHETCIVTQKVVGKHVKSWEEGIFSAKREKPDLIVLGELRTREAIQAALDAATSHLVIATTFASQVPRVFDVLAEAHGVTSQDFIAQKLGYLVRGVICQSLMPGLKNDHEPYGRPQLVYEVLVNDLTEIRRAIQERKWGDLRLGNFAQSASRSVRQRLTDLKERGTIDEAMFQREISQWDEGDRHPATRPTTIPR